MNLLFSRNGRKAISGLYAEVNDDLEVLERLEAISSNIDVLDFFNMYFLLYNPLDLPAFQMAANEMIPSFWMISDYSFAHDNVTASLMMLNEISTSLLLGAMIALLVAFGLLMFLFLRLRVNEIGIYLALGELKIKILGQMLMEVIIPTFVGIALALFAGQFLASEVSTSVLTSFLAEVGMDYSRVIDFYEVQGIRIEVNHEDVMGIYNVVLNLRAILTFTLVSIGTVFVSTLLPTVYIMKLSPKDILIKSSIG